MLDEHALRSKESGHNNYYIGQQSASAVFLRLLICIAYFAEVESFAPALECGQCLTVLCRAEAADHWPSLTMPRHGILSSFAIVYTIRIHDVNSSGCQTLDVKQLCCSPHMPCRPTESTVQCRATSSKTGQSVAASGLEHVLPLDVLQDYGYDYFLYI